MEKSKWGLTETTIIKISSVLNRFEQIEEAILYGSRAKGNYRPGSDIDLTLVSESLDYAILSKVKYELDELDLPYKIDLSNKDEISNSDVVDHINRIGVTFYRRETEKVS